MLLFGLSISSDEHIDDINVKLNIANNPLKKVDFIILGFFYFEAETRLPDSIGCFRPPKAGGGDATRPTSW